MFIATTKSPTNDTSKECAIADFKMLIGKSCDYVKNLENLGLVKENSSIDIYGKIIHIIEDHINNNWIS